MSDFSGSMAYISGLGFPVGVRRSRRLVKEGGLSDEFTLVRFVPSWFNGVWQGGVFLERTMFTMNMVEGYDDQEANYEAQREMDSGETLKKFVILPEEEEQLLEASEVLCCKFKIVPVTAMFFASNYKGV